jgi:hypothetical protein
MFKITSIIIATLLVGILGTVGQSAYADSIMIISGNGPGGGTDGEVNMLVGPVFGEWGAPITPAEFDAARNGPPAQIPSSPHPAWTPNGGVGTGTQWICDNQGCTVPGFGVTSSGHTTLFAHPFTLCDDHVGSAKITFDTSVDDFLGDADNEGLFINEIPIIGTEGGISHSSVVTLGPFDITSSVTSGQNYLYILNQQSPTGVGPVGVQYKATFEFTCSLPIGGTVGSMDTASLLIAGTQANMDYLWIITLVGGIAGVGIVIKAKTNKPHKETL